MRASGSCLCGAVRYTVAGPLRDVVACHCTQCRKSSGHHVAATAAPRAAVTISGPVAWYQSSPEARRGFCATCGANLFWEGQGPNLSIFAGTLDGDPGLRLVGHIYCADKGSYYTLADGMPQAAGDDPALTAWHPA